MADSEFCGVPHPVLAAVVCDQPKGHRPVDNHDAEGGGLWDHAALRRRGAILWNMPKCGEKFPHPDDLGDADIVCTLPAGHGPVEDTEMDSGVYDHGAPEKGVLWNTPKGAGETETHWSIQFRYAPGPWIESRTAPDKGLADDVFASVQNIELQPGEAWRLVEVVSTVIAQTKERPWSEVDPL